MKCQQKGHLKESGMGRNLLVRNYVNKNYLKFRVYGLFYADLEIVITLIFVITDKIIPCLITDYIKQPSALSISAVLQAMLLPNML